jgi:hypothetical protein
MTTSVPARSPKSSMISPVELDPSVNRMRRPHASPRSCSSASVMSAELSRSEPVAILFPQILTKTPHSVAESRSRGGAVWVRVPGVLRHRIGSVCRPREESEIPMPYQVKTAAAVLGGSALLAFAVGCGNSGSGSETPSSSTPSTSSTSSTTGTSSTVAPTSPAPAPTATTPGGTASVPGGPTGGGGANGGAGSIPGGPTGGGGPAGGSGSVPGGPTGGGGPAGGGGEIPGVGGGGGGPGGGGGCVNGVGCIGTP